MSTSSTTIPGLSQEAFNAPSSRFNQTVLQLYRLADEMIRPFAFSAPDQLRDLLQLATQDPQVNAAFTPLALSLCGNALGRIAFVDHRASFGIAVQTLSLFDEQAERLHSFVPAFQAGLTTAVLLEANSTPMTLSTLRCAYDHAAKTPALQSIVTPEWTGALYQQNLATPFELALRVLTQNHPTHAKMLQSDRNLVMLPFKTVWNDPVEGYENSPYEATAVFNLRAKTPELLMVTPDEATPYAKWLHDILDIPGSGARKARRAFRKAVTASELMKDEHPAHGIAVQALATLDDRARNSRQRVHFAYLG